MAKAASNHGQAAQQIIKETKLSLHHSHFPASVFHLLAVRAEKEKRDPLQEIIFDQYEEISRDFDESAVQSSASYRNCNKARRLAQLLIRVEGHLDLALLEQASALLQQHLYSLGPKRHLDAQRNHHILKVLLLLQGDNKLQKQLLSISKPHFHLYAETVVRDTLNLSPQIALTDLHAQQAAFSAWMTYLRQNVGSCFATAPALIIQEEQPDHFLKDIEELLSTGRLKRTFGGVEYSVPLSPSWGAGDLLKPFFLSLHMERLARMPGLLRALEAVDLIDSSLTKRNKILVLHERLRKCLKKIEIAAASSYVNSEQILRMILLEHHGIIDRDLIDYAERPPTLPGIINMMPKTRGRGGNKTQAVAQFRSQFATAQAVFKGLTDNALLKAWEFTLASFSDTKTNFYRWNLYASLGLQPEKAGGIGQCIAKVAQEKLDRANRELEELQQRYEQAYQHAAYVRHRLERVRSEEEAKWMQVDYNRRVNDVNDLVELREKVYKRSQRLANIIVFLAHQYDTFFPDYFQEIYDADMHDVSMGPYDDSPAGFRLLYKHGRPNTSLWTMIYTSDQFIDALVQFFVATESPISALSEVEGLQADFAEIVTAIVQYIRTKEFLESAFYRMAEAHQTAFISDPLAHLEKIPKKPWAYVSGGTMTTLVSAYYSREQKPTLRERVIENETDLCVFLLEALKELPPRLTQPYADQPTRSMLIQSPSHGFIMKPGLPPFCEGWLDQGNTYAWVKANVVQPQLQFVLGLSLDRSMMERILLEIKERLPYQFRHNFQQAFRRIPFQHLPVIDFRHFIVDTLLGERWMQQIQSDLLLEEIDSCFYTLLPLLPQQRLRESIAQIFGHLISDKAGSLQGIMALFDAALPNYPEADLLTPTQVQQICQSLLMLNSMTVTSSFDSAWLIRLAMRQAGLAMPAPLIFADSNWVKEYFGFIVNPGTGELSLWRVDYLGSEGAPMTRWRHWMDGSQTSPWSIYTHPFEYDL